MKKNKLLIVILGTLIIMSLTFSSLIAAQPTIRVLFLTAPDALNLRDMIPQFEQSYGIKVIWEDTAYADIHTKEISDFIAHSRRYDVIMMDNPWLPEFAGGGYIENLEPYLKKSGFEW